MSRIISKLLVDSNYQVEQFSDIEIEAVEKLITVKKNKKGEDVLKEKLPFCKYSARCDRQCGILLSD